MVGRSHWVTLLSEVLPRALLAEFGLAKVLLGSSGGGQFLVVLPEEMRDDASAFLRKAAQEIEQLSQGSLRLVWACTENLGDWTIVRKRLNEEMQRQREAPALEAGEGYFEAYLPAAESDDGLGPQASLSKNVNSRGTTGPFISGAEHRASLCRASLPAPSTLYGLSVRRLISFDLWLPSHGTSRFRSCLGLMFWLACPSL